MLYKLVGYRPTFDPRSDDTSQGGCGNRFVVSDFHDSRARTKIVTAPARTSKSFSAAYEVWPDIYPSWCETEGGKFYPEKPWHENDRLVWLVGTDYKTVKEWDYLWNLVLHAGRKRVPQFPYKVLHKANSPQQGNLLLWIEWGKDIHGDPVRTKIMGKSGTNPESLQGEQVDVAVLSEAGDHPEHIWRRYLSTRVGKLILPTTPKGSARWLLRMIQQGKDDPTLGIESFHFDRFCNPKYDHELFEIERKKAAASTETGRAEDDPFFAEQFLGEWTMAEERVLPFFAEPTRIHPGHVLDRVPAWFPYAKKFISCDYGFHDAAVAAFHAVGPEEEVVTFAEVYERRLTPDEFVRQTRQRAIDLHVSIDYVVGDPKKPEVAAHMRERGLPVQERVDKKAMADRAAGFMNFVDRLALDPETRRPRYQIVSEAAGDGFGCPKGIHELAELRRRTDVESDQWSDSAWVGDDHFFDAVRYGLMTRPKVREKRDAESRALAHLYRRGVSTPVSDLAKRAARAISGMAA